MANMNLANFDQKQPLTAAPKTEAQASPEVQAAAPVAAEPMPREEPVEKPLTEKLQSGEAIKTSLYLAPDMHKALKFMALEMSYRTDGEGKTHKLVRVNDLILLAVEQFLTSAEQA